MASWIALSSISPKEDPPGAPIISPAMARASSCLISKTLSPLSPPVSYTHLVIAEKIMLEDDFILIKTTMHILSQDVEGNVLLLPTAGSLHKIFKQLGDY